MRACVALAAVMMATAAAVAADDGPRVEAVATVSPEILTLTVHCGRMVPARQMPYEAREGDVLEKHGPIQTWVKRDGKVLGALVGKDRKLLFPFDEMVGPMLDTAWADNPASYRIGSPDDANYKEAASPVAVHRKSKPTDLAHVGGWAFKAPMLHVLYLRLPKPLTVGKRYTIGFVGGPLAEQAWAYEPSRQRSEAVHVTQVGFRPDDPAKIAFLSCWMGTGGGLAYEAAAPFHVLDAKTGRSVLDGRATLRKAADARDEDAYQRNYNLTNVYAMDLTPLDRPGAYRVYVEGVGCSYPFEVSPDAWRKAFLVSAKGFYTQRSGIALGPPWTTFRRPRAFHPDDGLKVYASTCPLMDSGNGLNAKGTDKNNFGNLVKGRTDEVVPNAWGGYFDAGDWDRRIQHLAVARLLLELADLFPGFTAAAALHIPESGGGLPDLVSEALWGVDFYRRMQTPEGGVRGGIESEEHPQYGEASWNESLTVMAYAPDPWCSYLFAAAAARAAGVLESLKKPDLAKGYRDAALKAVRWAEADLQNRQGEKLPHAVHDARNLAAAELFRLTGETPWHDLFLATTAFKDDRQELFVWQKHEQADAAFVYLRTDRPGASNAVKKNCLAALERTAAMQIDLVNRTAFAYAKINAYQPFWGVLGAPRAVDLLRAHAATGKPEYLRAAVLACQAGAGANPSNLCYTTGVGHAFPLHPLIVDQRVSGQAPPPGITVFGPFDVVNRKDHFAMKILAPMCTPPPSEWPTTEAYFDIYLFPDICEFVTDTLALNAYAWGYLAARK